jgi:hypothetical protein
MNHLNLTLLPSPHNRINMFFLYFKLDYWLTVSVCYRALFDILVAISI